MSQLSQKFSLEGSHGRVAVMDARSVQLSQLKCLKSEINNLEFDIGKSGCCYTRLQKTRASDEAEHIMIS